MGGSASTSSPSPAPSGTAPSGKSPSEKKGLIDYLTEDEELRKELRERAEKGLDMLGTMQPMQASAPAPINVNGGLLQQPSIIPMTPAGSGIYGMDPTQMKGGTERFMEFVGAFF